jgi:NAD(P)-dependent dehydrogenase (short-subunit alcohol dehydrogenase family)
MSDGGFTQLRFDGRVAIVTGAGRGLGREYALLLACRGARVVVNDFGGSVDGEGRSEGLAAAVAQEIRELGGDAAPDGNTVATADGGRAIVEGAIEAYGRVDILINNAGISRPRAFLNMTPDCLDPVLEVHLKGAFHVTQPAWIKMREQGYGRILNAVSSAGILGVFGGTAYGAAKMGLVGFTRVLATEGAKYNVKANAIAPIAKTRMSEEVIGSLGDRLTPALVAPLAGWLVHEECPVSGEIYTAGGGHISRYFMGLTHGYYHPELTMEHLRDNFDEIRSEHGYIVPRDVRDEFAQLREFLAQSA